MTGSLSLEVTGLPRDRSVVPAGTMNGPRGFPVTVSRLGVRMFLGVPTNIGLGRVILRTSLPGSWAAATGARAARAIAAIAIQLMRLVIVVSFAGRASLRRPRRR